MRKSRQILPPPLKKNIDKDRIGLEKNVFKLSSDDFDHFFFFDFFVTLFVSSPKWFLPKSE
jgi:hypothetical protein